MADLRIQTRTLILVHLLMYSFVGKSSASNLAYRRQIEASTTCGSPPEQYYETWQDIARPHERVPFICNASDPTNSHPAGYMVDGLNVTHWQAKAGVDTANITIDLRSATQKFVFVKTISIQFGAYQRPGQILYSKSTDGGLTYSPWHRYVTFPYECSSIFGVTYADRPFLANSVLCRTFLPLLAPTKGNESVVLDLYGGRSSTNTPTLQQWLNATNLRLQFTGLFRKFDMFSLKWHHYTVREISVTGSCFCNGHASECNINATSGERTCSCQNNACGLLCDRCCSAYNQYPWKPGTGSPFEVDRAAACQPCNCHSHSSSCVYNQTVAESRLSLNSSGVYSGGGVCQNCQHNTTGINCEICVTFFYRPVGRSRLDADVCTECNCSSLGTRNVPGVPYLDCIKDETINVTGMTAGDCYCKANVHGRKCDTCKPTFYNLSSSNPLGCQECLCHTPGTRNASNICNGDRVGNCPCKSNTEGRACDVCKDQFYNLTSINENGCQDCGCDPGGRASAICNKTTGQCQCKSTNITGRTCNAPADEFYFPNLHYLRFTMATLAIPTALRGEVRLPAINNATGVYYVIIKYTSSVIASNVRLTFSRDGSSVVMEGRVNLLSTCITSCYAYANRNFTLSEALVWNVFLSFSGIVANEQMSRIQIENVILLPSEFYHASVLGPRGSSFLSQCDILRNNLTRNGLLDSNCVQGVFSLTMGLLGDPFACACNSTGSINNICAKYEGQCLCKPGVTSRQCDRCLPGYFNFSSSGCTPCNCSGDNKVCNAVTGQCVCPVNAIGRTCGECVGLHWGWNSTTGCMSCGCNTTGSANLQCDLMRGNCSCKPGVVGDKCDTCLDTYTGFTSLGCSRCNCSVSGSRNSVCDKGTGQCNCKTNTIGRTCDQCNSQSFYLSRNHSNGCVSCICMGITSQCNSSQGYYYQEQMLRFGWRIGNETQLFGITHSNSSIGSGVQSIPALSATIVSQTQAIYWMAPPNDLQQRSLVQSYDGYIEFSLTYSSVIGATNLGAQYAILKGNSATIYQNMTMTLANVINVRRLRMNEGSWRYANGSTVGRSMFLLILAKPSSLLISASSYQSAGASYTTRIGGFSISNVQLNATAAGRALAVEQCRCGVGYSGSSCESCATGYKRLGASSHPYFGTCVPCECNGHSSQCDPDTGRCLNCQHNTTGDFCNQCLPGFYGNASMGTSSDCQKCPCDAPRTSSPLCVEVSNGTAQCLNCSDGYGGPMCDRCLSGYFGRPMQPGGRCQLCQCNNNSNICNTTSGVCDNCQFNTSGNNCERCRDGWYGDAILRTCQTCNCNSTGSVSNVCNHTTGNCTCKANVVGIDCSVCRPNSYGFDNSGCKLCNCEPSGSVQQQCNETGFCECKNHTIGQRCDSCTLGFYGLPALECQACNCNVTGSLNQSCSTSVGQCFCKVGVDGRQCTSCLKQFINFNDSGCTACGPCSMVLQTKINTEYGKVQRTYVNLQTLQLLASLTPALAATEQRYSATQIAKRQFDERMIVLQSGINRIRSDSLSQSVNNLNNRTKQLITRSVTLANTSSVESTRIQSIRSQAETAARFVISVNTSLDSIMTRLQTLKSNADVMLANSQGLNLNFTHEREFRLAQGNASEATAFLLKANSAFSNATLQRRQVDELSRNVSDLLASRNDRSRNASQLQNEIAIEQERLRLLLSNISTVQNTIRSTNTTGANISIDFSSLGSVVANVSEILIQSQAALQSANETMNNATGLRSSLQSLSQLVGEVQINLTSTRALVNQANSHSSNMASQANNLTSAFASAKAHGANAVNAVGRYETISRLINQSLEVSTQTNRSVQELLNVLQQPGNQNLTRKATTSLGESRQLLAISTTQQSSLQGLQSNMSESNSTFQSVKRIGGAVSSQFSVFLSLVNSLSLVGEYGNRPHSLEQSSSQTSQQSVNITNTGTRILGESRGLQQNMTEMASTIRNLNNTSTVAIEPLNQAWITTNNITNKLNSETNSPMASINNITGLIQQFNASREVVNMRLSSIQSKLAALKLRITRMQAAVRLNGSNSLTYNPAVSTFAPSAYSEMQMDFRTTQRNALLMFFGNSSTSSTTDKMSLKIVDAKVVFEYYMNGLRRSLTNWEVEVSDGFWRRVLATRQGDFSRLTVSVLASNFSRTYSSYVGSDSSLMNIPTDASLYVGALPSRDMINATAAAFDGCIYNVRVNKHELSLWNYTSATSVPVFCNSSQTVISSLATIQGVSFAGNGFVQLRMGNFSIQNYSRVEFNFRSLHPNGTLFAVKGGRNQTILYSVTLLNGNIVVFTNEARFNARQNTQPSGSYADGNVYRVLFERSTTRVFLSVTMVTTGAGPSPVFMSTSLSVIEEGTAMYFGGVNVTELGQLNTGYYFAGCISNVSLSNNITGGMDNIRLNDARLLQFSKGISFDSCLSQIENGARFLGNGYASATTPSQRLSTLLIEFKTRDPNGVLFYSEYKGAKFYISLYHGNVFLDYKNSSRNARVYLYTRDQTLNTGQYHVLTVIFSGSTLMSLTVDSISMSTQLVSGLAPSVELNGRMYFGGIPSNLANSLAEFPVATAFKGDFRRVMINGINYLTSMVIESTSVSLAGVPVLPAVGPTPRPTTPQPTTLPPTCAAGSAAPQLDSNLNLIGIYSVNSTLALRPPNEQAISAYLRTIFLITIEFRAFSPYGVVFFATNTSTGQFISLELVAGKLVYQFNSGGGLVQTTTTRDYAQGQWTRVQLLRMSQFGAMLVSTTQEYHNNRHGNGAVDMYIDFPFYLGSVPSHISISMLRNPSGRNSFRGCVREVLVQDSRQTFTFNLNTNRDLASSRNLSRCFASVVPMVRMSATGYLIAERNLQASSSFSISLRFRTAQRNGILWHIHGNTAGSSLLLEQVSGQVILTHTNAGVTNRLVWIDPNIPFNRPANMSYFLCNNAFHTIAVSRSSANFTITVDSNPALTGTIGSVNLIGTLYVGGTPRLSQAGLTGCLQSLLINGQTKDLATLASSVDAVAVSTGCSAT